MAKFIVVDEQRCLACGQCIIECALAHDEADTLAEAITSGSVLQSRVHLEQVGGISQPVMCRHCEDAPCMSVCRPDAIFRPSPDGPVTLDEEQCIGCKACVLACPFGVIEMSRSSKTALKCDLCLERTEAGRQPACVDGCPTVALEFREFDAEIKRIQHESAGAKVGSESSTGSEAEHESDQG